MNRYWHISKALQMYPSDPQHQYDNYNDATKYRRTGELMEISFQPLFIEGIPDGSSKLVIMDKPGYPKEKDQTGISTMYDYLTGAVILRENKDPNQDPLNLIGVGPPPSVWKAYLKKMRANNKRKADQLFTEFNEDSYRRVLRRTYPTFGNTYVNVIPNVGVEIEGEGEMMEEMVDEDDMRAQIGGGLGVAIPAIPVDSSVLNTLNTALGSSTTATTATTAASKRGGKKASRTTTTTTTTALSGSYLQESGTSVGAASGGVRASLLGNIPDSTQ